MFTVLIICIVLYWWLGRLEKKLGAEEEYPTSTYIDNSVHHHYHDHRSLTITDKDKTTRTVKDQHTFPES